MLGWWCVLHIHEYGPSGGSIHPTSYSASLILAGDGMVVRAVDTTSIHRYHDRCYDAVVVCTHPLAWWDGPEDLLSTSWHQQLPGDGMVDGAVDTTQHHQYHDSI